MITNDYKNIQDLLDFYVDVIGKNHGYNCEISVSWELSENEITELYKKLWIDYAINDTELACHRCSTCEDRKPNRPFHIDTNSLLDLTDAVQLSQLNRKAWTEEKIKLELSRWNVIQDAIRDLVPRDKAKEITSAYSLYNQIYRVNELYSKEQKIQILQSKIIAVQSLQIEEINNYLKTSKFEIVDTFADMREYTIVYL